MDPSKASLVNNMTDYPSGIYTLAEPERLAIRRWNLSDDWVNSYMTNAVAVYANGAYPHLEFQNQGSSTNATLLLDKVRARTRSAFGIP